MTAEKQAALGPGSDPLSPAALPVSSAPATAESAPARGLGRRVEADSAAEASVREVREPAKLAYTPIENGVDYLLSVTDHLADEPSPRDLKYAIVHLHSATEVLLKARLQREHWSFVFEKPEGAKRAVFEKGDFKSCGPLDAHDRLTNLAGLALPKKSAADLEQLGRWRNALQHYGLTVHAPAVEKLAANVLDFLLTFISEHLRPSLPPREREALDREMADVKAGLTSIKRLLEIRWKRIEAELEPARSETVRCPQCLKDALVFDGEPQCRFCETVWNDGGDAARLYIENVQDISLHVHFKDGGDDLVTVCPECDQNALVAEVDTAAGETVPHLCFQCGTQFGHLGTCDRCGTPVNEVDGFSLCSDCSNSYFDHL
ncbi:hypothetical protein C8250_015555 [Streptomyces sp. So13.3]|uniref:hypothetical protein n=1 Tax=unclassified Streptomyces TaxID=2593676 RepID=UPI0011068E88|nr:MULTISPECIES: hypothetical protein [unclassified Streptomyces]NEA75427.1 hypothetical protein [Streptomyces sp. SID13588]QNA73143.1 hypothetical protein C8250_015555 [Streptomyces sp. So13.3]